MPKTREEKKVLFASYQDIVAKGNFVIIETDRLPANVITDIRKALSSVEAKMYVIKNNIFAKAVEEIDGLKDREFVGQLSLIEGGNDIAASVKVLENSRKDAKQQKVLKGFSDEEVKKYIPFTHKFGYLDGKILEESDVVRLAALPDKQTMLGIVVGTMAAPISSFMNLLEAVPRAMVYALTDLQNKKAE